MSQLFLTLAPPRSPHQELFYCILSAAGTITARGRATPELLPKTHVCTLIVPAQALSWHAVQLPKLSRRVSKQKLQSVLTGLLEERLLDEPAALHLALCTPAGSDQQWVAACDKNWLMQAIQTLHNAGLQLSAMVPEAWPVSASDVVNAHISAQDAQAPQIIVSTAQGVVCWPLKSATALELPEQIHCSVEPEVAKLAGDVLQRDFQLMQRSQYIKRVVIQAKALGLDLAQGDASLVGSGRALQRFGESVGSFFSAPHWRVGRWGALLLVLVNLLGLNVWAWKQGAEVKAQRDQMKQIFTRSFPNVKVVLDAPLQMQRELLALRQSQGQLSGRDFESIYGRFSSAVSGSIVPLELDYNAGEVSIKAAGLSASQLEALDLKLKAAGLVVREQEQRWVIADKSKEAGR